MLTVELRPRLWEAFWATLVLFVGLVQLALGAAFVFSKPSTDFTCDRTTCHLVSHNLFGGTSEFTLDVAQLSKSRVDNPERMQHAWVVDRQGQRFEIGTSTRDAELSRRYEQLAHDFQVFLDDRGKPTFATTYQPGGAQPVWLFFVLGALVLAWAIKWRRGWKAKLVFDRAAGTLTIRQRPWARTRKLPLGDVASVRASDRVARTLYGNFRWEDIALVGRDARTLWRYRTMFTRKTYEHVQASVKAIQDYLTGSSSE